MQTKVYEVYANNKDRNEWEINNPDQDALWSALSRDLYFHILPVCDVVKTQREF